MGGAERYKRDLTRGICFGATARYGEDGSSRQDASPIYYWNRLLTRGRLLYWLETTSLRYCTLALAEV